ncbi:hypothetical protein GCM10009425_10620 [Pseudomonas asuensis]|uniref:Uncharacterized protein n=1 Tax=Pseudomonas asuensis TaxID=1825787 RepID=A0ABQ2GKU1_9PSED|nr:hypothetical protein GCM10009425_10620 [Pseudomonas asuensis]
MKRGNQEREEERGHFIDVDKHKGRQLLPALMQQPKPLGDPAVGKSAVTSSGLGL